MCYRAVILPRVPDLLQILRQGDHIGNFRFGIALIDVKQGCAPWKRTVGYAVVKLGLAIVCLFFLNSVQVVTYLYCFGLLHSAVQRFINAFRKTAIVYVQ